MNDTKKQKDVQVVTEQVTPANALSAEVLIAQAIDKNVPVETMEKLLAMRRELKQERAKEDYDRAMAQFQADCPTIKKTKSVKTTDGKVAYTYAPIETIVQQVKGNLRDNGFSYSASMKLLENGVSVSVKVTHEAGYSEVTEMTVPLGNKTNVMSQTQVVAAAQTFAKRYAFCNAFGILTGDQDDDANSVPKNTPAPKTNAALKPTSNTPEIATDQQRKLIFALASQLGYSDNQTKGILKDYYKIESFSELTRTKATKLIGTLKQRLHDKIEGVSQNADDYVDPDEADKAIQHEGEIGPH